MDDNVSHHLILIRFIASLCVDEIEQLVKEEFPAQARDKPPCSGTTLEQLLSAYDIGKVFSRSKEQSLSPLTSEVAPDKVSDKQPSSDSAKSWLDTAPLGIVN
jgi:hypothetical protein